MKHDLLKEFLESGLTQKAFAEKKKMTAQWLGKELWLQLMYLYKNRLVKPHPYSYEVRYAHKYKDEILKALSKLNQ